MSFVDTHDPIFWIIVVVALALIGQMFSLKKKHEDEQHRTGIEREGLNQDEIKLDRQLLTTGYTIGNIRQLALLKDQALIQVFSDLLREKGFSDIRIAELVAENRAVLDAAKAADKYEDSRRAKLEKSGRSGAASPTSGSESRSMGSPSNAPRRNSQADSRHRKSPPPDPPAGAQ